jgi:hypothetical protein
MSDRQRTTHEDAHYSDAFIDHGNVPDDWNASDGLQEDEIEPATGWLGYPGPP